MSVFNTWLKHHSLADLNQVPAFFQSYKAHIGKARLAELQKLAVRFPEVKPQQVKPTVADFRAAFVHAMNTLPANKESADELAWKLLTPVEEGRMAIKKRWTKQAQGKLLTSVADAIEGIADGTIMPSNACRLQQKSMPTLWEALQQLSRQQLIPLAMMSGVKIADADQLRRGIAARAVGGPTLPKAESGAQDDSTNAVTPSSSAAGGKKRGRASRAGSSPQNRKHKKAVKRTAAQDGSSRTPKVTEDSVSEDTASIDSSRSTMEDSDSDSDISTGATATSGKIGTPHTTFSAALSERHALSSTRASTARGHVIASIPGLEILLEGSIADAKRAATSVQTLKQLLQERQVAQGASNLANALLRNLDRKIKSRKWISGEFLGLCHSPTLVSGPAEELWKSLEAPSYCWREGAPLIDETVAGLVSDIAISEQANEMHNRSPAICIFLRARVLAEIQEAHALPGCAEFYGKVGAEAIAAVVLPIWARGANGSLDSKEMVTAALGLAWGQAVPWASFTSAAGAQRLLSALLLVSLSTWSCVEASHSTISYIPLQNVMQFWSQQVKQYAKLPLLFSSLARTQVMIASSAQPAGLSNNARNHPMAHTGAGRQQLPRSFGAGHMTYTNKATLLALPPPPKSQRHGENPKAYKFCGGCKSVSHCLWSCREISKHIGRLTNASCSPQQAVDKLIAITHSKYHAKGQEFWNAFEERSGKTRERLLERGQV